MSSPIIPLLFLSLFLLISSIHPSHSSSSSAFSFIKTLEGSHRGSQAKGLHELKKYLEQFGYLEYPNNAHHVRDDYFDDNLVSAVKKYQRFFRLKATGVIDADTVSMMIKPRCGNPDILTDGKKKNSPLRAVTHYELPSGRTKWSKYALKYKVVTAMPKGYEAAVDRSYQRWAKVTKFTFTKVSSASASDLTVGFFTGDHGDNSNFGPGGSLAHATYPPSGKLHFDTAENWTTDPANYPYHYDVESVGAHELGHNLGLAHSKVPEAIMSPTIYSGVSKAIHADDLAGIKALYG